MKLQIFPRRRKPYQLHSFNDDALLYKYKVCLLKTLPALWRDSKLNILGADSGSKHSQSHWMKFPFWLVESHPAASVHTLMRAVCGGYRPIRICRSLPRHTSHARPSPRRIAAHKHARGHYLIVPPRRDNVDNIFSWLHQSLMRHQGGE